MASESTDKTSWNLNQFYKSTDDSTIEEQLSSFEKATKQFYSKHSSISFEQFTPERILEVLNEVENLFKHNYTNKILNYFQLLKSVGSLDAHDEERYQTIIERIVLANNDTMFVYLRLGKLNRAQKDLLLSDNRFVRYRKLLQSIFESGPHQLSEETERFLSLQNKTDAILLEKSAEYINNLMIQIKGKDVSLTEALARRTTLDTEERRKIDSDIKKKLKSYSFIPEVEINTQISRKEIDDKFRNFKQPYEQTLLGNENSEHEVFQMIEAVNERFELAHKFYDLKRKFLGLDVLKSADLIYIKSIPKVLSQIGGKSDEQEAVMSTFRDFLDTLPDERYRNVFEGYLENGNIDLKPKKGKGTTNFTLSTKSGPTMILMNFTDQNKSYHILAHEMGHAYHSEQSRGQSVFYSGRSISVSETISEVFVELASKFLESRISEEEQVSFLMHKLNEKVNGIFRQAAHFNFELALHNYIHIKGYASASKIAELLNEQGKRVGGHAVELDENDGYSFIHLSHIRKPFYVYAYPYANLLSIKIHEKIKENPLNFKQVENIMAAGNAAKPIELFGSLGIDTEARGTWENALNQIESEIDELEELIK